MPNADRSVFRSGLSHSNPSRDDGAEDLLRKYPRFKGAGEEDPGDAWNAEGRPSTHGVVFPFSKRDWKQRSNKCQVCKHAVVHVPVEFGRGSAGIELILVL